MIDPIRTCGATAAALVLTTIQAVASPLVLHFAPGATEIMVRGRMTPGVSDREYSLEVRKGQTLTMHFDGAGPLRGTIDCKGGSEGPFSDGFAYVVPQSGACVVNIGISRMAERWTGAFKLKIQAK